MVCVFNGTLGVLVCVPAPSTPLKKIQHHLGGGGGLDPRPITRSPDWIPSLPWLRTGSPLPLLGAHLDAPGQRRRQLPSPVWTRHRAVKQGKSGASVGTTSQGKGKGSREGKIGQGGRGRTPGGERPMGTTACGGKGSKGRAVSGDRPIGAASCRPKHTIASCQPPPTPQEGRPGPRTVRTGRV